MATATRNRTRKSAAKTRRPTDPAKVQAARERDAKLNAKAAALLEDQSVSARLVAVLGQAPSIMRFSIRNQVLLMDQAEERGIDLRMVATFRQWQEAGRQVRKGEKGLWIVRPVGRKDEEAKDGETPEQTEMDTTEQPIMFRGMVVFDISQTDDVFAGEEGDRPAVKNADGGPAALLNSLRELAQTRGYAVTTGAPAIDADAKTLALPAELNGDTIAAVIEVARTLAVTQSKARKGERAPVLAAADVDEITVL